MKALEKLINDDYVLKEARGCINHNRKVPGQL